MHQRIILCLLALLALHAAPSSAQLAAPWVPWTWTNKMQFGPVSLYAGQRFSLIADEKTDSTYVRDYDLAIFSDWTMSQKDQFRAYVVFNPYYVKHHPQVKSQWWLIYGYYERDLGSGWLRLGKVPYPFNYLNGFPEWHSQVRRVTRLWDYGMTWTSKPREGWQWEAGWVSNGTTSSSDVRELNEPALVGRVRAGVGQRLEAGLSGMLAPKRTFPGLGEINLSRFGGHLRWLPSSRLELRGEYVSFHTLSQGGPIRAEYAGKPGHGWVAEGIYQFGKRAQLFANYNSLQRAEGSATRVDTLTFGGRIKLHDRLYLIPEAWLVDDQLPKTHPLYDDNRVMLTSLVLF